jgi:hypothetical protein
MMIKMSSIEQFRHTIKSIRKQCDFKGELKYPVLEATGRVKLHGTNASVVLKPEGLLEVQSKNNVITPDKDNAGFAKFIEERKAIILNIMTEYKKFLLCEKYDEIALFGEFCGKGINKGAAICEIDKAWFIFGAKILRKDSEESVWLFDNAFDPFFSKQYLKEHRIFYLAPYYKVQIDFNAPEKANNEIEQIVYEIETECPVAKQFGISGIGEGIVFKFVHNYTCYFFKAKGDKHSKTKVKKIAQLDADKISKAREIADKVTPIWRLEQMYNETFDTINGGKGDVKKTGDYLRNVIADVYKEESDIIEEAGLTSKDVNKYISFIARDFLFKRLDE